MDLEIFYKDKYDRAIDRKNEINTSLSTPIGILTALTAAFLYAATNFDYNDRKYLSFTFIVIALVALILLGKSIYHLIRALSDLHDGYEYAYLNEADIIDNYYLSLIIFYTNDPNTAQSDIVDRAKEDFDEYVLNEWIKCAGINEKNNNAKTFQRFKCHQYMIYTFISLSLLIIPFGIDFEKNKTKDKIQQVKINSEIPVKLSLKYIDTSKRLNIKSLSDGKPKFKKTNPSSNVNDQRGHKP